MGCGGRSIEEISEALRRQSVTTRLSRAQAEDMIRQIKEWWPDMIVIWGNPALGRLPEVYRAYPPVYEKLQRISEPVQAYPIKAYYSTGIPEYRNEHPDQQARFLKFQQQVRNKSVPVNGKKFPRKRFI